MADLTRANLIVRCITAPVARANETSCRAMSNGNGSGNGPDTCTTNSVVTVALLQATALPVPWSDVFSFSPDVFAFASRNAVDATLGAPEASILLARWKSALYAAVGEQTGEHLSRALRSVFAGKGPRVLVPPPPAAGLESLLLALPPEASRVVAFGATGGRAEELAPRSRKGPQAGPEAGPEILPVACYDLERVDSGRAELESALAPWRVARPTVQGDTVQDGTVQGGTVTFDVGAASLADALCDALEDGGYLPAGLAAPAWMKFLPRHESARTRLEARLQSRLGDSFGTRLGDLLDESVLGPDESQASRRPS